MYRKLVPFNGRQFGEVDKIALHRTAAQLKTLLPAITYSDDYEIQTKLAPALERSMTGQIDRPFVDEREFIDGRYIYERMEGELPDIFGNDFQNAFAKFSVAARSIPLDPPEIEIVNGVRCAWMDFEEEGDWPDKVKYP
jgi:hypothetical protein